MKYTPPYTDEDERSCIRKAQTGDINSFGGLVEKYKSLLKAYCIDTLQCPFDRAEDIAHEAFCLAWENIGTYVYDAAFFKWLCSLAQSPYETACMDRNNQNDNFRIKIPGGIAWKSSLNKSVPSIAILLTSCICATWA